MTLESVLDVAGASCILLGATFALIAAFGLVRLPDVLNRMHAASKPQALGVLLVCLGAGLILRDTAAAAMLALAVGFQLVTAPVATHMVAKAAHRAGQYRADIVDDERDDQPRQPIDF